jgi:hypothetical protein
MKDISKKELDSLREHFKALGWTEADIRPALAQIKSNPKKQTVVMPKHYEEEAKLHAKHTCEAMGYRKGTASWNECYKEAFERYLTDAYLNSKGIEIDDDAMKQNPTTPRSLAAFEAVVVDKRSPYRDIISTLEKSSSSEDNARALKFQSSLKSAGMNFAHMYLTYVGKLVTRQISQREKGFVSTATSFQFMEKMAGMSPEAKESFVREVGHNNLMRSIVFSAVLKSCEPVFRMKFEVLHDNLKTAMENLPANIYTDRGWLTRFHVAFARVIEKQIASLDIESAIASAFDYMLTTQEMKRAAESQPGTMQEEEAKKAVVKITGKPLPAASKLNTDDKTVIENETKEAKSKSRKKKGVEHSGPDLFDFAKKENPTRKAKAKPSGSNKVKKKRKAQ